MPERTIHERFMKKIIDRNCESSIIHEMSDTIDRTIVRRRDAPEQRIVVQPSKYPYKLQPSSAYPLNQGYSNESKQERNKSLAARESALLERLEQILTRVQQLETLQTESSKPKETIAKQGKTDIPQINITIPFLDVVIDSVKSMEVRLTKLQDTVHALRAESKCGNDHGIKETRKCSEKLHESFSSQLSELLIDNRTCSLKIQEELSKVGKEKSSPKLQIANLVEEVDDMSLHSKHSSQSSVFSAPVQIENGTRPSQAFIHFSPERTNTRTSVVPSPKLTNDEEEEIEL